MMMYRSLVVGLLGAVAMLLTEQGAVLERVARQGDRAAPAVEAPAVGAVADRGEGAGGDPPPTVVHISRRGAGDDPLDILGLGPDEIPMAIDDRRIAGSWRDAVRARWRQASPGSYFELWIRTPATMRRMLVLVSA